MLPPLREIGIQEVAEREHARLGLFKPILLLQALPYQKSQALQSYTVSPFGIWVPLLLSFRWLTLKIGTVGGWNSVL